MENEYRVELIRMILQIEGLDELKEIYAHTQRIFLNNLSEGKALD